MAWSLEPSGKSHKELIERLQKQNIIKSFEVATAMLAVDRSNYCSLLPYVDTPQSIGYGATISAPHMHAYALEILAEKLTSGEKALDVGSGSGYLTACMGIMLGKDGVAVGVEHIPELVELSNKNVRKGNPDLLKTGQVKFFVADGRQGYPQYAPYNAIHVGAAASELPTALINQLKVGGRLVLPVGPSGGFQQLEQVDKTEQGIKRRSIVGVRFVPLTSKEQQWPWKK